jgi:hypothetical protein
MTETIREIGGNSLTLWLGKKHVKWGERLSKKGERIIKRGSKTIISNPTSKLINPFTIILNFTVDTNVKYQLLLQGDYKIRYKESGTDENPITTNEMFMLIIGNSKKWFLKG